MRQATLELREVPSSRLTECFQEAKVQAGGFIPSNGLIAKIWRDLSANAEADAQSAIRRRNNETLKLAYQAYESDKPQREFLDDFFKNIQEDLR